MHRSASGRGLERTDHRPWPLRGEPWTIAQSWEELLFMHWRVRAGAVRELVPEELELQEHDGSAWLGDHAVRDERVSPARDTAAAASSRASRS